MSILARAPRRAITHEVPAHLVDAFLQNADEFLAAARGGQTNAQRAAELRAQDRDAGLDALAHLLTVAETDTGQARWSHASWPGSTTTGTSPSA